MDGRDASIGRGGAYDELSIALSAAVTNKPPSFPHVEGKESAGVGVGVGVVVIFFRERKGRRERGEG